MIKLSESSFLLYAAANYNNTVCYTTEEFYDDLNTFTYVKRLFSRYHEKNELKERLILNHLIKLYNIFNYEALTRMLFFRIEKEHWGYLKTFLIFLNYMPTLVYIDNYSISSSDITVDQNITKVLRNL